jgi:hypothetical protein
MNGIRTVGFLLIASTLCVLSPLLADVQAKRFQVGYFQVSPHAMPDVQGRAQGVAVAYFKRIVEKMGIADVHFRLFPLQRLLVALENNQLEMALLFARNPGREAAFVYPRRPFCYTQPCIAVPAAHWLKTIESIAPLLTLSIQESAGAYRSAFIQDPRIKLEPMHGDDYTPRCFSKLLLNRIDACYQPDHYPLVFEANKNAIRFPHPGHPRFPNRPSGSTPFSPSKVPAFICNPTKPHSMKSPGRSPTKTSSRHLSTKTRQNNVIAVPAGCGARRCRPMFRAPGDYTVSFSDRSR